MTTFRLNPAYPFASLLSLISSDMLLNNSFTALNHSVTFNFDQKPTQCTTRALLPVVLINFLLFHLQSFLVSKFRWPFNSSCISQDMCKYQPLSNHTPVWSDTSLMCHCHPVWCGVKAVLLHISDRWKANGKEHCLGGKMLKWWGLVPFCSAYSVTTLPSGSDESIGTFGV